jgi:predicted nucleic-acid-binding Zn-ribbon protein
MCKVDRLLQLSVISIYFQYFMYRFSRDFASQEVFAKGTMSEKILYKYTSCFRILDSRGCGYEDFYLMRYNVMYSVGSQLTLLVD